MILILSYEFSSSHLYYQKTWSSEKNLAIFGKCFTEHGHGHNYRLELEVEINTQQPATAKSTIDSLIKPVIETVDHQHLNFQIPWFKEHIPTTENISLYLKDQIVLPAAYQLKILRLFEMDSIFVELTV